MTAVPDSKRIDYAVPRTCGALAVRRLPNYASMFIPGEPRYHWLVIHRPTDAAFCDLGSKAAAMSLAAELYQRLPGKVWRDSDFVRVSAALSPELRAWVKARART